MGSGELAMLGIGNTEEASLQIKLKPLEERSTSTKDAAEKLRRALTNVPGSEITVKVGSSATGTTGSPVEVSIRGDDLTLLEQLGNQMLDMIKGIEGIRNAASSLEDTRSELQLVIDREKASLYGLSAGQVLSAVRNSFDGQVVSRMRTGDDEVDIRLETSRGFAATSEALANLTIVSPTGARVPVEAVAAGNP